MVSVVNRCFVKSASLLVSCLFSLNVHAQEFTVNTNIDAVDATPGDGVCAIVANAGQCSLRAAIQETNALSGADIIYLGATSDTTLRTYTLSIGGTGEDAAASGDLDISDDIKIIGSKSGIGYTDIRRVIDANGIDRVFHIVGSGHSVTLEDVTIQNGNSGHDDGGGIYAPDDANFSSALTLKSVTITQNKVLNLSNGVYPAGGGLYIGEGYGVFFQFLDVSSNMAYLGGGIFSRSSLYFDDGISSISSNTAFHDAGATNESGGMGGGLYLQQTNSGLQMISSNLKTRVDANTSQSHGAGIYNDGAMVYLFDGSLSNNATELNGSGNGAAIFSNAGEIFLEKMLVQSNAADSSGGALYLGNGISQLVINNTLMVSNSAAADGGAVYSGSNSNTNVAIADSTFSRNTAGQNGGALNFIQGSNSGNISIQNVTFNENHAATAASALWNNWSGFQIANSIIFHNAASTTTNNCNAAISSSGSNIDNDGSCGLGTNDVSGAIPSDLFLTNFTVFRRVYVLNDMATGGNPAIDAGNTASCSYTDQKGSTRNGTCDIGAREYMPPSIPTAEPGKIQFSTSGAVNSVFDVSEDGAEIVLTVARSTSANRTAVEALTIHFQTVNDSAIASYAGSTGDYIHQSGELVWANGEVGDKTITIPVINNSAMDGDKLFTVWLYGHSKGAKFTRDIHAKVRITDDDAVPLSDIRFRKNFKNQVVSEGQGEVTIGLLRTAPYDTDVMLKITNIGNAVYGQDFRFTNLGVDIELGTNNEGIVTIGANPGAGISDNYDFKIEILNDDIYTGEREIELALAISNGLAVVNDPGVRPTTIITIQDDEAAPATKPTGGSAGGGGMMNPIVLWFALLCVLLLNRRDNRPRVVRK